MPYHQGLYTVLGGAVPKSVGQPFFDKCRTVRRTGQLRDERVKRDVPTKVKRMLRELPIFFAFSPHESILRTLSLRFILRLGVILEDLNVQLDLLRCRLLTAHRLTAVSTPPPNSASRAFGFAVANLLSCTPQTPSETSFLHSLAHFFRCSCSLKLFHFLNR